MQCFASHLFPFACFAYSAVLFLTARRAKGALRLKTMLPNAELNIIKKAGHEVNKDNPIRLGEVLNGFLR
ncbi:hypothetical protein TPE_2278 [Treponema pedis str. T A4]|uniref:Alpha/beta hydrolase n=1 Tax=Treponema pedis str. T A4 TaxID=1291379 RepID=S5ZQ28_9SPIR|nr:hypothetical protein TPE_2278 [Treponema pedis str. T A4]